MKKLLAALLISCCTAVSALAQNAVTLPIAANAVADLGNGPVKVRMVAGNASIFTAQGSGLGSTSGSSTALTLTATPATPPLVGGLISGSGIASGTTIAAYNGTTGITLSAAMTVSASTPVAWGAACPSSAAGIPAQYIQASAMAGYYIMYTQARVCAVSPGGPVNTLLIEPVFNEQPPFPVLPFMLSPVVTVNFGNAGDTAIPVPVPLGFTQIRPVGIEISQCTGSLSGASFGLFTTTGGGGAALVTSGATSTVTNNTVNTNNNFQNFNSFNNAGTLAYTPVSGNVQFRVGSAAAASCFIAFIYSPVS
jgi:hypothetical protein